MKRKKEGPGAQPGAAVVHSPILRLQIVTSRRRRRAG
jgi:hypothetical protein